MGVAAEDFLHGLGIDGDGAVAGIEADACDRGLAAASAVEVLLVSHGLLLALRLCAAAGGLLRLGAFGGGLGFGLGLAGAWGLGRGVARGGLAGAPGVGLGLGGLRDSFALLECGFGGAGVLDEDGILVDRRRGGRR